ncbi:MAG: M2 family metallopeptidase, partial [Vulcanimicrobiota bacterium]
MNPFRNLFLIAVSLSVLASPGVAQSNPQEVQDFLDRYTTTYLNLYKVASEAEWASNTVIIEGVQTIDEVTKLANEALSQHTGSVEVIEAVRGYLAEPEGLTPLQVKQLNSILYTAANSPQTVPQLVKDRIAAENKQNSDLFGFTFTVDGQEITPNEIDRRLEESTDLKERKEVWVASKEVGRILKDGLANLVGLRNETVQNLGYDDYFSYQVADYGMTTSEMVAL